MGNSPIMRSLPIIGRFWSEPNYEELFYNEWKKMGEPIDDTVAYKIVCIKSKENLATTTTTCYAYVGMVNKEGKPHGKGLYYRDTGLSRLVYATHVKNGYIDGRCKKFSPDGRTKTIDAIYTYNHETKGYDLDGEFYDQGKVYFNGKSNSNGIHEGKMYRDDKIYEGKFPHHYPKLSELSGEYNVTTAEGNKFQVILEKGCVKKLLSYQSSKYEISSTPAPNIYEVKFLESKEYTYAGEIKVNYFTEAIIEGVGTMRYIDPIDKQKNYIYEGYFVDGKKHGLGYMIKFDLGTTMRYMQKWEHSVLMSEEKCPPEIRRVTQQ